MRIAFTGHRDRTAREADLRAIAERYPEATWVHGGARGFDSQIDALAKALGVPVEVLPPDYERYGSAAPFIRNRAIVDSADMLIALYDGRKHGGTAYTIRYAHSRRKPVSVLRQTQQE